MAENSIDQKKAEKLKIMGNSMKEFLKAVLILFITVIICTYVALNIIFTGYLPAEIIFPTSHIHATVVLSKNVDAFNNEKNTNITDITGQ